MSNMVVRTNVLSLNSHRNLGAVSNQQTKASARLSSGFRINSAADDAAGLAISEKMRAQIRGLDQAARNSQDGISLIQTAEGAMSTVNEMVSRIRELVIQASNDTNAHDDTNESTWSQSDRTRIQDEINQLLDEIDQVTKRTEFNTRTLLDGSLSAGPPISDELMREIEGFISSNQSEYNAWEDAKDALKDALQQEKDFNTSLKELENIQKKVDNLTSNKGLEDAIKAAQDAWMKQQTPGNANDNAAQAAFLNDFLNKYFGLDPTGTGPKFEIDDADVAAFNGAGGTTAGGIMQMGVSDIGTNTKGITSLDDLKDAIADALIDNSKVIQSSNAITTTGQDRLTDLIQDNKDKLADLANDIPKFQQSVADASDALTALMKPGTPVGDAFKNWDQVARAMEKQEMYEQLGINGDSLYFQVGANSDQGVRLNIEAVDVRMLSAIGGSEIEDGFSFADLRTDDSTYNSAGQGVLKTSGEEIQKFIKGIDFALSHVQAERSNLGAMQNRLEYTIESLEVSSENLSAANSRIRDADMAKEMMALTQSNVLQQAATAMLAQANQAPQSVLQLLG